jgi:hypothetical protein
VVESKGMKKRTARLKKQAGRKRIIRVGAVNITMHPHDSTSYLKLLHDAKRAHGAVPLYGKNFGRVGVFAPLDEDDPEGPHYGEFHRYFNIDVGGRWYDTAAGQQADEKDVAKIAIPANLKPDYEAYRFVFYPELHRLFFEQKAANVTDLAPAHVKKLLDGVFASARMVKRHGAVEVTVEPEADTVERILSIATLRLLRIEVTRPNTDDLSAVEQDVFERLSEQNAETVKEIYVAQRNVSLIPSQRTKSLCVVAASNGEVYGEGKNEKGRAMKVSTTNYPWVESAEYISSVEDGKFAFLRKAGAMFDQLRGRIRSGRT